MAEGDIGEGYDRTAEGYDEAVRRNEAGARRLVQALPPGDYARVLDVGCGTGFASLAMAGLRRTTEVVGIDRSPVMLDVFRAKAAAVPGLSVELHAGDAMDLDVPWGTFDAAISSMALHWMPDRAAVIARMARALRPGGVLGVLASGRGTDLELQRVMAAMDPPVPRYLVDVFPKVQVGMEEMDDWLVAAGLEPLDVWMDVRLRHQDPAAYMLRLSVTAGHLTGGMPDEAREDLGRRMVEALQAAAGPRGFRYTFVKLFAVARRPA